MPIGGTGLQRIYDNHIDIDHYNDMVEAEYNNIR